MNLEKKVLHQVIGISSQCSFQDATLPETPSNSQKTLFGVREEIFVPSSIVLTKVLKSGTSFTSLSFEV
jgi:hypothetical protein